MSIARETFKKVDDLKKYVEDLLANGAETFTATKKNDTTVVARPGIVGEIVETYTKDGNGERPETISTVKEGMWVVTMADKDGNPIVIDDKGHFNTYTNTAEVFENYERIGDSNVYKPRQTERVFVEVKEDIQFTAPWGSVEKLKAGGYLNITNMDKEIYGIAKSEFHTTHDVISKGIDEISINDNLYTPVPKKEKETPEISSMDEITLN